MRKFQKDNKGFSLVELLIALVIGSILVAGIGSIMVVSSRSFASTSAEAGMQSSAQIVMDHIQDVVVDANQKVIYSYTTSSTPGETDWTDVVKDSDMADPEAAITFKRLSVYTYNLNQISSPDAYNSQENKHYDIIWEHDMSDPEKSSIRFDQQLLSYNPSTKEIVDTGGTLESEKLADNVTSFKCDLSDMEKKRIIYVEMNFSKDKGRHEYHVANNISLRNKVALSTDSISVSNNVTLETLSLTAEPGMDLPLSIKSIITQGNASNAVTYEFDGADGGKTAAGTVINGSKLTIDRQEQAPQLSLNAVDSMGGKHPFVVYINRVIWTDEVGGAESGLEGIEFVDAPAGDTVDAGSNVPISVKLNSYPGAPGTDRTKPEKVTGEIVELKGPSSSPVVAPDSVKLEPAGDLGWLLIVKNSVKKDTKIKLRFTADHSLANGGIAVRTVAYPGDQGVYKELELTVTEAGVGVSKSPFLRGMMGKVIYPDYLEEFFNEAGKSEWEEYKRIPNGQIDNHYLAWKPYASRPAVDGSKNHNYRSENEGWTVFDAGATTEKYDDINGYTAAGWHVVNGGKHGNFQGSEFVSLNPDVDTGIVFAIVVQYKEKKEGRDAIRWWSTTPAQTMIYGFREQISIYGETPKYERQFDLGSIYKLDTENNRISMRRRMLDSKTYLVWQKEACFDNLSFGGNDGGLDISTYLSDTAFEGGNRIGHKNAVEEHYGLEPYSGSHNVYMARVLPMSEIQNRMDNNFFNKFKEKEKEYYIWPRFTYNGTAFDRTSGYLAFKMKQGNIELKNNKNATGREGFVPYPGYTNENGIAIEAHPDFYAADYTLDSTYTSVGQKTVRRYNNSGNYSGNIGTETYSCSMRLVDGVYYLRIGGLADYRFDPDSERWEFVKPDTAEANLASGAYHSNKKDVYLPGPDDEEFFTGFKNIADQQKSDKRFADRMAIYKAYNGKSQIEDYKIAYYRENGKYCVDIYTLGDKNVYKKYTYNEPSKQWESKGNIFDYNVVIRRVQWGHTYYEYYYIPTKNDIEWYNYQSTRDWISAAGFMRYRLVDNSWERFPNGSSNTPTQWYRYKDGKLEIRFAYGNNTNVDYEYNFDTNKWE